MVLWVLIITLLLGIGFVGTRVASMLRLPHSVLLVLLGIVGGSILKWSHAPIPHDWGESFFLVLQGELEVEVASRPRLEVGDFFGEMSLLFGCLRSATVRAVVDAELAEMHRQDFETLLKQYPHVQTRVRAVAEQRLQEI